MRIKHFLWAIVLIAGLLGFYKGIESGDALTALVSYVIVGILTAIFFETDNRKQVQIPFNNVLPWDELDLLGLVVLWPFFWIPVLIITVFFFIYITVFMIIRLTGPEHKPWQK